MSKEQKLHSLLLVSAAVVLFLILISSTASASIIETRITKHGTASSPDIYCNGIVWQDTRNGQDTPDIYMIDLSTKKETKVTTNSSGHYSPAVHGDRVVWTESWNGSEYYGGVYVKDLSTKKQSLIITSSDLVDRSRIYGDKIVFALWNVAWPDIYMHDLSTSRLKTISTSGAADQPDIYGNKIVWRDNRNDWNPDIYLYDLSTSKEKRISTSGKAESPAIYNQKIVWEDKRNGNWDIYMYDLSTQKKTQITTNKLDQQAPVIYGNNIVWQDNRNGNWDIYAYDLVTHQQIHTTDKSDQVAPAIYNNKVVWTDYRNGKNKPDIYMGTISYLPVAAFTASPSSGKKPLTVKFTDKSTDAYSWYWDFGDKTTSKLQSPGHKYTKEGKYTVSLTVKNAAGSNTAKKTNYITVKKDKNLKLEYH